MSELKPDVALGIALSAIMCRDKFTQDPGPVIDELRAEAGGRSDLLAAEVGKWIGYYGGEHTATLAEALRAEFAELDLAPRITLGLDPRNAPPHGTHDFHR